MKYTIKKGRHFAGFRFPKFHNALETLEFVAIFDKSCLYHFGTEDDLDVNKLYGISWGLHHESSVRIGWNIDRRFDTERIALYTYTYCKGIRNFNYIASVDFNKPIQVNIHFDYEGNKFYVMLNPCYVENNLSKRIFYKENYNYPDFKIGFRLNPYFGGTTAAPHKMTISIHEN